MHYKKIVWYIVLFSYGYTILRYNIIKGTDWAHLPVYIGNKAVSLAGSAALGLSFIYQNFIKRPKNIYEAKRYFGLAGFALLLLHWILSEAVLNKAYLNKFFEASGKLSLVGELMFFSGVIAFLVLILPAIMSLPGMRKQMGFKPWLRNIQLSYLALIVGAMHTFLVGYKSWITPWDWHGYMPSISLLSFVFLLIPFIFKALKNFKQVTIKHGNKQ